MTYVYIDIYKP